MCPRGVGDTRVAEKEDGMAPIFPLRPDRWLHRGKKAVDKATAGRVGSLIRVGIVLLLCGMIGFAVYQVARHMTTGLSTLRTQEIVDSSYVGLDLYLFRDEAVLTVEGSGVASYDVANGEKVGVGTLLGTAYDTGDMTPDEVKAMQARLNATRGRLSLMEALGGQGTPADARAEAEAIDRGYLGLLHAANGGDLSAVSGFAGQMLDSIGRYGILTGGSVGAGSVTALKEEQQALLAGLSPVSTFTTDRSGHFYHGVDGYESVFPYDKAMSMTPAEFRAMASSPASSAVAEGSAGAVGKMVYSPLWYAAAYVPLDDPSVEVFQQGIATGVTYRMTCGDSAETEISLTIERMEPDGEGVLLVFSSQDMPAGFIFSRMLRVETVARTVGGYRIPAEALVTLRSDATDEDTTGVYILAGGVVEFRKVRIRVRRDGYVIAETYEEVQALLDTYTDEQYGAATADGWSYLRLNDNIIVSGNELYEGKMIS